MWQSTINKYSGQQKHAYERPRLQNARARFGVVALFPPTDTPRSRGVFRHASYDSTDGKKATEQANQMNGIARSSQVVPFVPFPLACRLEEKIAV